MTRERHASAVAFVAWLLVAAGALLCLAEALARGI